MAIRVNGDFYISGEGCPVVTDGSITESKIADGAVTAAKIYSDAAEDGDVLAADGDGGVEFVSIIQMPDPTNAEAGDVLTADGDGGAEWSAPAGGGASWVGITAPTTAVSVTNSGDDLSSLTFAGSALTANSVFRYRATVRVSANPNNRNISMLFVQLADADVNNFFKVGEFSSVTSAATGTTLHIDGTFRVRTAGDPGSVVAEFTPSRHSSTADGVKTVIVSDSATQFVDCDTAAITRIRIRAQASAGTDLELQVEDFAYRVDTAEAV